MSQSMYHVECVAHKLLVSFDERAVHVHRQRIQTMALEMTAKATDKTWSYLQKTMW